MRFETCSGTDFSLAHAGEKAVGSIRRYVTTRHGKKHCQPAFPQQAQAKFLATVQSL